MKNLLPVLFLAILISQSCTSETSSKSNSADTVFLDSGVKYIVLQEGDGPAVEPGTEVATNINLMINGTEDTVWSTYGDIPFAFVAKQTSLIQGFDELVMLLQKGDRILAVIPSRLGYGARGNGPGIPPNATLYFDLAIEDVRPPRLPAADVLFESWQTSGVAGIMAAYDTIKNNDDKYKLGDEEWYKLSLSLADNKAWDDIVSLWDFKLKEDFLLGGYYYQAKAYDSLNQINKAIATMEEAVRLDSTQNPNIKGYLEELKSRK